MIFGVSILIFGEMNFYLQGILAGGTGGIWGYFVSLGMKHMNEIQKNKIKFSTKERKSLLKKHNKPMTFFIFLDIVFLLIIKYFHLY
jgi:hypothetical protein